ncbi:B-type cyclin CLB5 NDAI_0A04670 [Naumovozyma dairenensis CBS 421]|uniref:Uncharacterized protein n=1 Tax=Naumovozyma dairenensis (strain ATCC 10597 / BCRC 20456 / CBS 421 / NBRC 0211 / NRRL Y-12639) TaxID=1071378 RepID=G0W485_NAUDC|nr:hypothetical protein NDAI_0A04670 [Naumovozyma dairenensis CBS 421]CCD22623.1 hypothetical protein NDAI_0A04670 [Naumovozyma dairenensis CBS 421]
MAKTENSETQSKRLPTINEAHPMEHYPKLSNVEKEKGLTTATPEIANRRALNEVKINNQQISDVPIQGPVTAKPILKVRREESDLMYVTLKKRRIYHDSIESQKSQHSLDTAEIPKIQWEDLDTPEMNDVCMVAEYSNEIFTFLYQHELELLPSHNYLLDNSSKYFIRPSMRAILVDWLVEVHDKFQCYPETLFLAINIMDRFLSQNKVSMNKLQLLAITSLFVAAKFEEVHLPKLSEYSYITDGAASKTEIKNAEMFMLTSLGFSLGYPNPMNFLRRISKADSYNFETRNIAKCILEFSICYHSFITLKPSLLSTMAMYLARRIVNADQVLWNETLRHYSGGIDPLLDETFQSYCKELISEIYCPKTKLPALILKFKTPRCHSVYFRIHKWCGKQLTEKFDGLFDMS